MLKTCLMSIVCFFATAELYVLCSVSILHGTMPIDAFMG